MFQLTEMTLFYWDLTFEFLHHRYNDPKNNFAGATKVQSWISKLQSSGQSFPQASTQGSSASAHSLAMTVATTDHAASSESQLLLTPMRSPSDGVRYCISDVKASDGVYCKSVGKLPRYNERMPSMDIIEVNSAHGQLPVSIRCSSNKATENYTGHDEYNMPVAQDEDVDVEMQTRPPSCNHDNDLDKVSNVHSDEVQEVKAETGQAHVTKKATNKDLPVGAQPEFCQEVILTMWHWAAGHLTDPFNIDKGSMVKALEIMWKCMYTKYVHFNIPPIVSMWCNGFTSAAMSALTSLFVSDVTFLEYDNWVTFALEMLEHYRFLYSDSTSKDPLDWTGMWCGPLFLQVFVSQLNATTSCISCITELGPETRFYDGSMALAVAAVERTLTLIANGEIDIKLVIEDRESMGSKCKRKSSKTSVWKVKQPNGPPQPFLDTLWGGATCDFMTLLRCVPHDAMNMIIDKAPPTMANATLLDPVKGQDTSFDDFIKYVHFGPLPLTLPQKELNNAYMGYSYFYTTSDIQMHPDRGVDITKEDINAAHRILAVTLDAGFGAARTTMPYKILTSTGWFQLVFSILGATLRGAICSDQFQKFRHESLNGLADHIIIQEGLPWPFKFSQLLSARANQLATLCDLEGHYPGKYHSKLYEDASHKVSDKIQAALLAKAKWEMTADDEQAA
ncbi:hypothetical protein EI94DRAFT_1805130 [Lactarius quietus]|nr:hypothetical protein EI94DRAFT_1805130 [Lactarius quietus]